MAFSKIELRNFRCFDSLTIDLSSKSNLFFGKNGSGKTSILESVYVASSGRSFRTANLESLIRKGSKAFYIKAFDNTNGSILEKATNLYKEWHYNIFGGVTTRRCQKAAFIRTKEIYMASICLHVRHYFLKICYVESNI